MSDPVRREGVTRLPDPSDGSTARWLSSGYDGGFRVAPAAYNVTVPEGFDRTDLAAYGSERRELAGFDTGPTLLTGVSQAHARCARAGSVVAVATAGLSNPAALPMDSGRPTEPEPPEGGDVRGGWRPGTVNLLVVADRPLTDGGLASLHGAVVEARTATLLAETGFPGTTSDAAVVGCPGAAGAAMADEPAAFAGSATAVGSAARACVRDAVAASLRSRYGDEQPPASVDEARHGATTTRRAKVEPVREDTKD